MKKLRTAAEEKKRQRRNNLIISIILIFVISASTFGIVVNSFNSNSNLNTVNYNGYKFIQQGNYWALNLGNVNFTFRYNPYELENISLEKSNLSLVDSYVQKPLYFNSQDYYSTSEIYTNLVQFTSRFQEACYNETNCPGELPIKTCEDNFIIIKQSNIKRISQQGNCVFIEGNPQDLQKLTDLFLYKIFGIQE